MNIDIVTDTAPVVYVVICHACNDMEIPFKSTAAEQMGRWAAKHMEATGHSLTLRVVKR